ncbi:MAG TPA: DNA polymerase III subunit delta [Cytophagaceae bacterium]
MQFSEIPGLQETKRTLINSVKNNHVAHAQLFSGTEGNAALAMALAYATYINCEDKKEEDSCGVCASCTKINKLIHPDIHFVYPVSTTKDVPKDALSNSFLKDWRTFVQANPFASLNDWANHIGAENKQLNISVDESRNLIKTLALKAFEADYKVMIIWLPEFMNSAAANAILKILEEPPYKTLFLLVTQNQQKIITTILSRTQRIFIRPFTDDEIKQLIVQKFNLEDKKAQQIAYLADGNLNEAFRLIEEIQEDNQSMFRDWMRLCYKRNNIPELVEWSEEFQKMGKEAQKGLFQYGINIMRESLVYKLSGSELLRLHDEDLKFVEGFSKVMDEHKIEKIYQQLNDGYYHIERNANAKIAFLDISFSISNILKSS